VYRFLSFARNVSEQKTDAIRSKGARVRTRGEAHWEAHEKILEMAAARVHRDGHEKLSLREIARDFGLKPASIYDYFESKEAILQALAGRAAHSLRDAIARRVRYLDDDGAMLTELGLSYVAWARAHPKDFVLLWQRPRSRHSESPFSLVVDAVRRAHEAGAVFGTRPANIEELAYALWATAHGMAMLQVTHASLLKTELRALDGVVLDTLVAGWR
jgi:AcrR family transcriptional regulator